MDTTLYQEVLHRVEDLSRDDQLRLIEAIAALLRRQVAPRPRHSIMELQGLGKEIWQSIDIQEYVDQERSSWNG